MCSSDLNSINFQYHKYFEFLEKSKKETKELVLKILNLFITNYNHIRILKKMKIADLQILKEFIPFSEENFSLLILSNFEFIFKFIKENLEYKLHKVCIQFVNYLLNEEKNIIKDIHLSLTDISNYAERLFIYYEKINNGFSDIHYQDLFNNSKLIIKYSEEEQKYVYHFELEKFSGSNKSKQKKIKINHQFIIWILNKIKFKLGINQENQENNNKDPIIEECKQFTLAIEKIENYVEVINTLINKGIISFNNIYKINFDEVNINDINLELKECLINRILFSKF